MADISYTPTTWADGSEGGTPINSTRLNNIENGIVDAVAAIGPNDTTQDGTLKAQIDALDSGKASKNAGMSASFAVWDDANNQWQIAVKTPSGKLRHLIFKDSEIIYTDENYNLLKTIA